MFIVSTHTIVCLICKNIQEYVNISNCINCTNTNSTVIAPDTVNQNLAIRKNHNSIMQ